MKKTTCNFTLKALLLLMLLCLSNKAFAYDFEENKLQYTITSDSTVKVSGQTYWDINANEIIYYSYNDEVDYFVSYDIVIPGHISYNNMEYAVTEIGDSVFYCATIYYSNVCADPSVNIDYNITIPETVTLIGYKAFGGVFGDVNVYCHAITPPMMNDIVDNGRIFIYVPSESYTLYKEENNQNHFFREVYTINGERSSKPTYKEEFLSQPCDYSDGPYGCAVKIYPSENSVVYVREINNYTGMASECDYISIEEWKRYENRDSIYFFFYEQDAGSRPDGWVIEFYAVEEGKNPSLITGCGYLYGFDFRFEESFDFDDSNLGYNIIDDYAEVTYRGYHYPWLKKNHAKLNSESMKASNSTTKTDNHYEYYDEIVYYSGNVVIPSTAIYHNYYNDTETTYPVKIIGDNAFKNCSELTSITIPESITSIGIDAFYNCIGLTELTWNAKNCDSMFGFSKDSVERITIGDKVECLPYGFAYRSKITNIFIPNSVTHILGGAFEECNALTSVIIPNSVIDIGDYAFSGCQRLTSVSIGSSIISIDEMAFANCNSLMRVTCLGMTPPQIYANCFGEQCYQNATLCVPNSAIEDYRTAEGWCNFQHIVGFYNMDYDFVQEGIYYKKTGDTEVSFVCGPDAYSGSVTVPTEVTYQGVTYAVIAIGDGAFADASLTSLSLPVTITSVGAGAFEGCVIQSLYITGSGEWTAGAIGAEVTNLYVGSEVSGIKGLQVNPTKIYSYAAVPPICDEQTFLGYNAELHVPASSLAAYFTAPYWCNFTNIVGDAVELIALSLDKTSIEALVGSMVTLTATLDPTEAVPNEIIWTTSNESVATVEDGMVTLTGPGECDIMAACQSKMAVCHVTATVIMATEVILSQESAKLEIGSSLTLTATVIPDDATYKAVTWATTDSTVAVVSDGVITAIGTGECFIIASCGECQAMCRVIVVEHLIYITLDEHDVDLLPNHIIILTPSVTPVSTDLVVTSSDPSVAAARLANGLIQVVGVKEGTAMITLNSADGYAEPDSCLVTVYTEIGDVNSDGFVNVTDVTTLISQVALAEGSELFLENADVNYDGVVNITDVTLLINYIMGTGGLKPKDLQPVEYIVNGVKFNMMRVRGGTFNMGATVEMDSDANANESPVHQVTLSSYYIGQTEVTQELWQAVMGSNPSNYTGDLQRPVEKVSYNDCQLFIAQLNELTGLNFRLPTEAEWEYAARGGKKSHNYRYAGSNDINEVAWFTENSDGTTHPVATKKANELGIYDMSGNVCEWCGEWFSLYPEDPQINPVGPETGKSIVHRGGSLQFLEKNCAVTRRNYFSPGIVRSYMGFRLVL
ncbi:MAG: SUMF1/EgtB/PvdO family nonheme iron enzyme [Muribaculaceae bacterium]|nr:SUMF1/EgtB/PvdO family nonheme iron enzyme [Muribaculaceae bacterium]